MSRMVMTVNTECGTLSSLFVCIGFVSTGKWAPLTSKSPLLHLELSSLLYFHLLCV